MQHHGTHIRMAGCVERGAPSRGGRLRWLAASAAALFLLLQLSSAGKAAHTSKPTSSIRSYHIRPSAWPKPAERRVDCPAVPGEKASALALALKSGRYMNFTSTLDQYYIQQFSALLNSLAINNPGKAILIHVLAGGLTNKQACAWRQAMIAYRPSLHIFLYNITREVISRPPERVGTAQWCYARRS